MRVSILACLLLLPLFGGVSVIVQSPDGAPIPGADIQLRGNGHTYGGKSRGRAALDLGDVPPGDYELIAVRPHFEQNGSSRITIPPGITDPVRVVMRSVSTISGRMVDSHGKPVRNARVHLYGSPRSLPTVSVYDWILDRLCNALFPSGAAMIVVASTETGHDGRFQFTGVFPGWYRLMTDPDTESPRVFYPGVYDWQQAGPLTVEEGRSLKNLRFRLPEFTKASR